MRAALAYLSFRYVTAALPASCSRMYEKEFFGKNINMMILGIRRQKMKKILYTIKDPAGIHARPAGMLVKEAKQYESRIQLQKDGKKVSAANLIGIMGMGLRCGDQVEIFIEGPDEDTAEEGIQAFMSRQTL